MFQENAIKKSRTGVRDSAGYRWGAAALKGMVGEGLTEEAHLSKNVKVGRENKMHRFWGAGVAQSLSV